MSRQSKGVSPLAPLPIRTAVMAKMQEADIEELALERLRELGYDYAHG